MNKFINNLTIDELQIEIGKNVKRLRKEKGFSQLYLSQEMGHSSTTILSQAELGKGKHFNIEQLHDMAKVLDCHICDFFTINQE